MAMENLNQDRGWEDVKAHGHDPEKIDDVDRRTSIIQGEEVVNASGHRDQLQRHYGLLSICGLALTIDNAWVALGGSIAVSINNGGPAGVLYELLVACFYYGFIAASIAELTSSIPSAGGVYHWASVTPGPRYGRVLGFFTGSLNFFGWIFDLASIVSIPSNVAVQMYAVFHPDLIIKPWHVYVAFILITWSCCALVVFGNRLLPALNQVGLFLVIVGGVVTIIVVAAMPKVHAPNSAVWGDFSQNNAAGWSNGVTFLTGVLNGAFTIGTPDAVTHMSEELPNPARDMPRAVAAQIILGTLTSFLYAIAILYGVNDLTAVVNSNGSFPLAVVYSQATGSKGATFGLLLILFLSIMICVLGTFLTVGRIWWALARDNATPFSGFFSQVNEKLSCPVPATVLAAFLCTCFGAIQLGSKTAFTDLVGSFIILTTMSYALAIGPHLFTGRKNVPQGPFWMGSAGYAVNAIAVLLIVFFNIMFCFRESTELMSDANTANAVPAAYIYPTTESTMNYNSVILVGVLILTIAWWFIHARTKYPGPKLSNLSKLKKPGDKTQRVSEDHAQSPKSQLGLPLQSAVSNQPEVNSSQDAAPPVAATGTPPHRSADLKEAGFVNSHDQVPTAVRQGPLTPQSTLPSGPLVNEQNEGSPDDATQSRDLWEEAFDMLDDTKKVSLSKFGNRQGADIVEEVAKRTKERYLEHEKRGWRISRGEGKTDINLRAVAEQILSSVLSCKKLIDAAVSSDPTGHAFIGWSVVSLGLQMVKNDVDRLDSMFEACETLTDNLSLCAAIEANNRDRHLCDSQNLEKAMVGVYVAILDISAEIVSESTMNGGQRMLKSITSLKEEPLQELKRTLKSKQKDLDKWRVIIDQQYRKQADKILTGMVNDLTKKMSIVEARALTDEDDKVLAWFSDYQFSKSQRDAAALRDDSTATWILDSPEYNHWKRSGDRVLWLYGNSGCGKSVLCSRIIEDLIELCGKDSNYVYAYWYFSFGSQDSLDIDSLLCCLIKQLCHGMRALPDRARDHWTKYRKEGPKILKSLLPEILDAVVSEFKSTFQEAFVVLDALDEYPLRQREELLHWLEQFSKKHDNVHILVTSRDENDVRGSLRDAADMDVANCAVEDVKVFIKKSVEGIVQKEAWKKKWKLQMDESIERVSDKRFRWASLMKDTFSACVDDGDMDKAVRNLPDTVEAMYSKILTERISCHENKSHKAKARLIFIWLAYSLRPLTLRELAYAASLPDSRKLLEICTSSLVSLQRQRRGSSKSAEDGSHDIGENEIVKFDHFSVKEYLTSDHLVASGEVAYFYASPVEAHLNIAEISIAHLLKNNDVGYPMQEPVVKSFQPETHGSKYSTSWYKHVQRADAIEENTEEYLEKRKSKAQSGTLQPNLELLRCQIHRLLCKDFSQSFQEWFHLCDLTFQYSGPDAISNAISRLIKRQGGHISPIWVTSLLDLPDNVQRLLSSGACVDGILKSDSLSNTTSTKPIQAAAIVGNLRILRLLLESNASLTQSELDSIARENCLHGADVVNAILDTLPGLKIQDSTLLNSAKNLQSGEIFRYILERPDLLKFSESLLVDTIALCLEYHYDDHSMERLMDIGDDIGCGHGRMMETWFKKSRCGRYIRKVIDRYQPEASKSQDILEWVFDNKFSYGYMLPVILEHYKGNEVVVGQDTLVKAASDDWYGYALFSSIVHHGTNIIIDDHVMDSILHSDIGDIVMSLLMDHKNCPSKELEESQNRGMVEHLYKCPIQISEQIMEAAARWEPDVIGFLQAHALPNIRFRREVEQTTSSSLNA